MATAMLPELVINAEPETVQVLKHLFEELEEIVKDSEATPEVVHWTISFPCPVSNITHTTANLHP